MKKNKALAEVGMEKCEHAISGHDHIHAANCGHKNYVHAGHICYEHDGHFHYMHNGHAHACAGPFVATTVTPANRTPAKLNQRPATVVNLNDARSKKPKK
jgi:hypothetical protein